MIRAAGGVPWRWAPTGGASGIEVGIEVGIVHRPRYDDWSLPKGKLDPDEHPLLGAVREVREETGLTARVGRWLTTISYTVAGVPKTVDYWAMEVLGGQFTAGEEIGRLRWLTPAAARPVLTNAQDGDVIEALLAVPCATTAVLVVRHGRAGRSSSWNGDDALRPLDETGRRQAERFAELLPVYRPARVLTAHQVRCVDSVRPLAERLDVALEVDPDFSEDSHAEDPERMAGRLRSLATAGEPVVVCSQGGVIPDTVTLLAQHDQVTLPAQAARKGSIWALHFTADGRLAGADYYPRPAKPVAPATRQADRPSDTGRPAGRVSPAEANEPYSPQSSLPRSTWP